MSESQAKTPTNSAMFTIDYILRSEPKLPTCDRSNQAEPVVSTSTSCTSSTNSGALTLAERLAGEKRTLVLFFMISFHHLDIE